MIFLNVGWMRNYEGLSDDAIIGGGSFVQEHGYGWEIFNFQLYDGCYYGYASVRGSISIDRLGGSRDASSIDDILVVWVSKSPRGGVRIIGWYDKATVYKTMQPAPEGSPREHNGEKFGYYVKARKADCKLLPIDERVLKIPRKIKGGMGQSNIWYADTIQGSFREKVLNFVQTGRIARIEQPPQRYGKHRQPDPYRRQEVEKAAVKRTTEYYEKLGYTVNSVERDGVGWDLEATLPDGRLRLEVKGLSQKELLVEFTPNEYMQMKEHSDSYRICVVTDALSQASLLRIFSFSPEIGKWEDDQGNQLKIDEVVSARITML